MDNDSQFWGTVGLVLMLFVLLAVITGCSTNRYFSEEEDAKAREVCEAAGCVIVPAPQMLQLLQRLQGQGI